MFVPNKWIHDHHKGNGNEKQPLKQEKKEKMDKNSIKAATISAGRNANLPVRWLQMYEVDCKWESGPLGNGYFERGTILRDPLPSSLMFWDSARHLR
jgi:hypothetical protein